MEYRVTRSIDFCYGHRLVGHQGKCRYLHGHNGRVEVAIESSETDEHGMVADFGDVGDVIKGWIDTNIDHRMVLSSRDPAVPALKELEEPLYLMDEDPTAENLSKHIYEGVKKRGLEVTEVRLWETPNSFATYRQED